MKPLFSFLFVAVLLVGCGTPKYDGGRPDLQALGSHESDGRPGVQAQGAHEYMFVKSSGRKVGFSALEFEQIARQYAEQQRLQFQFEGTEKMIWIRTDGSPIIADVYFIAALGEPSLHIEIDRDGKVKGHNIQTYVCGTGSR
jgi:hypothetical protein